MHDSLLKQALDSARQGQPEGFENLFILTYKDAYRHAALLTKDENQIWQMIRATYVGLFREGQELPDGHELRNQIYEQLDELGSLMFHEKPVPPADGAISPVISEERAATILAQIDEETGFTERWHNRAMTRDYVLSGLKALASVGFLILTVYLIVFAVRRIQPERIQLRQILDSDPITTITTTEEEVTEVSSSGSVSATLQVGLQELPDGKKFLTADHGYLTSSWMDTEEGLYYFGEDGYAVTGEIVLDHQLFTFWNDGLLTSIGRLTHTPITVSDSIQVIDGTTYYLKEHDDANQLNPYHLYRITPEGLLQDQRELVLSNVQDYMIYDSVIYYMQNHTLLKQHLSSSTFQTEDMKINLVTRDDGFYMVNDLGSPAAKIGSSFTIDNRVYRVDNGRIKYVKPAVIQTRGITYYFNGSTQISKGIYWKSDSGQSGILANDGNWIDSFCLVDDWIYYSAYMGKPDGVNRYSQLYRINIDGTSKETLSAPYPGHMLNLYYYPEKQQIYGEYTPNTGNNRGALAAISLSGNIELINDAAARAGRSTTGEDTLELVMVSGNKISCYWHDCNWYADGGPQILWTVPIELSDSSRIPLS